MQEESPNPMKCYHCGKLEHIKKRIQNIKNETIKRTQ